MTINHESHFFKTNLRSACVRMKGVATSIDLQSVSFEIQMISSFLAKTATAERSWLDPVDLLFFKGDFPSKATKMENVTISNR